MRLGHLRLGAALLLVGCQYVIGISGLDPNAAPGAGGAAATTTTTTASSAGGAGMGGAGMGGAGTGGGMGMPCGGATCKKTEYCAQPPNGNPMCTMCGATVSGIPGPGCMPMDCQTSGMVTATCVSDGCSKTCSGANSCNGGMLSLSHKQGTNRLLCENGACANLTINCDGPRLCEVTCDGPGSCAGMSFQCDPQGSCSLICKNGGCGPGGPAINVGCGNNKCAVSCDNKGGKVKINCMQSCECNAAPPNCTM